MRYVQRFAMALFVALFALSALPAKPAHAATTWHVTTLADTLSAGSLRYAVVNAASGDTIDFSVTGTISLTLGQIDMPNSVSIVGPGASSLTVDGGSADRIFLIEGTAGNVSMSGMTLAHGVQNNSHFEGYVAGGAILNSANLTLNGMVLTNNSVDCATTCANDGVSGGGGAIMSTSGTALTITNSTLSSNTATKFGGAIFFNSTNAGSDAITLTNDTFSGNQVTDSSGSGGAVSLGYGVTSTFTNVNMLNNTSAGVAGAVDTGSIGVIVTNSTFSGNQAQYDGFVGGGGAIYVPGGAGSGLKVGNSTFTANTSLGEGGGIYNNSSTVYVYNSTFSGNSETMTGSSVGGGAIGDAFSGTLFLYNDTLSGNSAASTHGGELAINHDTVQLVNTILANSTSGASDCLAVSVSAWSVETDSILQTNDGSSACPTVTYAGVDPKLAPLANNSGPTQTMALLAGSPAIDAGNDTTCQDSFTVNGKDQRGITRPQGAHCDVGAYERIAPRVPADFDGNGSSDLSIFRPSTGTWYVKSQFNTAWGQTGDVPVPADYNAGGHADVAIWRPSTGVWMVKGLFNSAWGTSGDVPVPGDYNGDGLIDLAVWRPSNGTWYIKGQGSFAWGQSGDIPVPGDYNGDGKTELAVFRPSTGEWYIKGVGNFAWGQSGDIPVPADYNGDGKADIAIFRPSSGIWYVKGLFNSAWGVSTDIPVAGDFNGDGKADVAIFRPSTGQWMVKNQFTTTWGVNGDFPLVAPDTNGNGTPYQ